MAKKNKKEIFQFDDELEQQREQDSEERAKRRIPFILPLLGCGLPLILVGGLLLAPYVPKVFQKEPTQQGIIRNRIVTVPSVLIEGSGALLDANLGVTVNGHDRAGVASDGQGLFAFPVDLRPGENIIIVTNPDGTIILTEIINYETEGPQIVITYPADLAILTNPNVTVLGTTDPGATVTVNGDVVASPDPVADDGQWSAPVVLVDGTNTITAVAQNENGTTQDHVMVYVDLDNNPNTPAGDPPPSGGPGGGGSTPPGGGGSTPPGGGGGSTPPGGGGGSTPPGGPSIPSTRDSGQAPPGGGGSTPPGGPSTGSGQAPPGGGGGSTPPGGGGSTPPGGGGVTIFPSKVIISKVLYNGDTPEGGYGEYIELRNTGTGNEDISSWQVFDTNGNTYVFGSYTMSPGETIRIGTNQGNPSFATPGSVWDHLGEPAYLRNSAGNLVDIYSY